VEAYPFDALVWGPVLPYATSLTFVAPFLIILLIITSSRQRLFALTGVAGLAAAGAFLWHSSFPFSTVVFAVPLLAQLASGGRIITSGLVRLGAAAGVGILLLAPFVDEMLGSFGAVTGTTAWQADRSPAQAIGDALTSSHSSPFYESVQSTFPQWWVAALLLTGVVAATHLSPPYHWAIVSWAVGTGLFVLASSFPDGVLRSLTSPWYSDQWRLWGLMGLGMVLMTGVGLGGLLTLTLSRLQDRNRAGAVVLAGAVMALLVLATDGLYARRMSDLTTSYFAIGDRAFTRPELAAYEWLSRQEDAGGWIMNERNDGSAMMMALEGLRPVWGHYFTSGEDQALLFESFNELETNTEVQRVLRDRSIRYVVVGNSPAVPLSAAPGLTGLDRLSSLELVYDSSDTKVYRVDGRLLDP
jgi:hypothetical protein